VYYLIEQDGGQQDCDLTFEVSFASFEPHLFKQGDVNDLSMILNLSKKQLIQANNG
jgi:hypothetical protein